MANPIKSWVAGEELLADDLNDNFDEIWATNLANALLQLNTSKMIPKDILTPTRISIVGASDNLKISADTERSSASLSYAKVKEILVQRAGVYRIKFDLKDVNVVTYGKIYKNGAEVGTERTSPGTNTQAYTTYSEDLTFAIGDLIQLYIYTANAGFPAQIRNFRAYFDYLEALDEYTVNTD